MYRKLIMSYSLNHANCVSYSLHKIITHQSITGTHSCTKPTKTIIMAIESESY